MDMTYPVATISLRGTAPYTQSKMHAEAKLEGESHEDYDIRCWRSHQHVETRDGKPTIVIPAHGMHQCLEEGGKRLGKIAGKGQKTWGKVFSSGIMLTESPSLNVAPSDAIMLAISANANGRRGPGTRVTRRFPSLPAWATTFEVILLDPQITEPVFRRCVNEAGLFVGIGMFAPRQGGYNGRFILDKLVWQDNRRLAA